MQSMQGGRANWCAAQIACSNMALMHQRSSQLSSLGEEDSHGFVRQAGRQVFHNQRPPAVHIVRGGRRQWHLAAGPAAATAATFFTAVCFTAACLAPSCLTAASLTAATAAAGKGRQAAAAATGEGGSTAVPAVVAPRLRFAELD